MKTELKTDAMCAHLQLYIISHHLLWSQTEELVSFVQHQVAQPQEEEAVAGQQTDQTERSGHQQQAWN